MKFNKILKNTHENISVIPFKEHLSLATLQNTGVLIICAPNKAEMPSIQ